MDLGGCAVAAAQPLDPEHVLWHHLYHGNMAMITSNNSGRWIHVIPNGAGPYISPGAVGAGMIRYSSNMNQLEVNDGVSWQQYRPGATIDLSSDAQNALAWAYAKMQEEVLLEQLMEKHPGLRDLHERFAVMLRLVQKENNEQA